MDGIGTNCFLTLSRYMSIQDGIWIEADMPIFTRNPPEKRYYQKQAMPAFSA